LITGPDRNPLAASRQCIGQIYLGAFCARACGDVVNDEADFQVMLPGTLSGNATDSP